MDHQRSSRAPKGAPSPKRPKAPFLQRLGRGVARHHRWTALLWLALLVVAGYLNAADKGEISDNFRIPGTDSQAAYDLLEQDFPAQNAATATVVYTVPEGQQLPGNQINEDIVAAVTLALDGAADVQSVTDPLNSNPGAALTQLASTMPPDQGAALTEAAKNLPPSVSSDGTTAYGSITFSKPLTELLSEYPPDVEEDGTDYDNPYSALTHAVASVQTGDVSVAIGGPVADTWNQPVSWWANHADEIGLGIGALLLLVAFGSLFGMLIPIVTALFGAVTASGFVYLLATVTDVSSAAPPVTLMISIGVGLDYSLLIVTRYREFLHEGVEPHEAAGLALASAGKASVFAGLTVCIALLGLLLVPIPLVQTLGLAAAIGVATMIVAATTLLPTLLGFAGGKIDRVHLPHANQKVDDPEKSFWGRFAHAMSRRPWFALIGGTLVLVVLAVPFTSIHFGMPDDSSLPEGLSQRTAYIEIGDAFGPGTNGPLIVAVGLPEGQSPSYTDALTTLEPVSKAVGALQPSGTVPNVQYSVGPIPNDPNATTAVIYQVIPSTGPDAPETAELVRQLRDDLETATAGTGLDAHVGGSTATLIDLSERVTSYLPIVIAAVVAGSFVLLVLVFRSILVPLKAAVMNLVSIAAAYGVVVAVFQWGWAKDLVGLSETIPIVAFVPLVMFVILFGLSMDYEVFLMSRIREEWDRTHEPRTSVVLGVANTARVITTAALIMIAVFASFVTNASPTVKLIGFGMAVAVLIDSTIVRMVLVPSVMELMGKAAWWFPRWLNWLPELNVEGPPASATSDRTTEAGAASPGGPAPDASPEEPVGART